MQENTWQQLWLLNLGHLRWSDSNGRVLKTHCLVQTPKKKTCLNLIYTGKNKSFPWNCMVNHTRQQLSLLNLGHLGWSDSNGTLFSSNAKKENLFKSHLHRQKFSMKPCGKSTHDSNCDYLTLVPLGEVIEMEEYLKTLFSSSGKKKTW
jgi:hypothetical protein